MSFPTTNDQHLGCEMGVYHYLRRKRPDHFLALGIIQRGTVSVFIHIFIVKHKSWLLRSAIRQPVPNMKRDDGKMNFLIVSAAGIGKKIPYKVGPKKVL